MQRSSSKSTREFFWDVGKKFPPGSPEAQKFGCKCPVHENHSGAGIDMDPPDNYNTYWWIDDNCPLHSHAHELEDDKNAQR